MDKLPLYIITVFLFIVFGCAETQPPSIPVSTITEKVTITPNPTSIPNPNPTLTPTLQPAATPTPAPAATVTIEAASTLLPALGTTSPVVPTPTPIPLPTSTPTPVHTSITYFLNVSAIPSSLPPYNRDTWNHWIDADGDCQNTRAEVLIKESSVPVSFDGCRVTKGEWSGFFKGQTLTDSSKVEIDHMVPLANAHKSGGWRWDSQTKQSFANYIAEPDHLIAVSAEANRSKGSRGPEDWKPTEVSYWCQYAKDWAAIKERWLLSVTNEELTALKEMTSTCPGTVEFSTTILN